MRRGSGTLHPLEEGLEGDGRPQRILAVDVPPPAEAIALHQVEVVQEFCSGASVKALTEDLDETIQRCNAWLDDRSYTGVTRDFPKGYCRPHKGPLTASELYRELKKPVWRQLKPALKYKEVARLTGI